MVSYKGWGEGNQFEDASGAGRDLLCNLAEVYQGEVDASGQRYPLACDMEEVFLYLSEEASGASKGYYHGPHIFKYLVPFFHTHPFLDGWGGVQDFL